MRVVSKTIQLAPQEQCMTQTSLTFAFLPNLSDVSSLRPAKLILPQTKPRG